MREATAARTERERAAKAEANQPDERVAILPGWEERGISLLPAPSPLPRGWSGRGNRKRVGLRVGPLSCVATTRAAAIFAILIGMEYETNPDLPEDGDEEETEPKQIYRAPWGELVDEDGEPLDERDWDAAPGGPDYF